MEKEAILMWLVGLWIAETPMEKNVALSIKTQNTYVL